MGEAGDELRDAGGRVVLDDAGPGAVVAAGAPPPPGESSDGADAPPGTPVLPGTPDPPDPPGLSGTIGAAGFGMGDRAGSFLLGPNGKPGACGPPSSPTTSAMM